MKYPTLLDLISVEFEKAKISYVLVGGFAVNCYKVTRATADIDFLITEKDYQKAMGILEKAGYKEMDRTNLFVRLQGSKKPYLMDVDFIFIDHSTLDEIIREGKRVEIVQREFVVPSVKHLIALKLHAIRYNPKRETKDLLDIIGLVEKNDISVRSPEFRNLCLKYGTENLYEKIQKSL